MLHESWLKPWIYIYVILLLHSINDNESEVKKYPISDHDRLILFNQLVFNLWSMMKWQLGLVMCFQILIVSGVKCEQGQNMWGF